MKVYKLNIQHLNERTRWLNDPRVHRHMNMQIPINHNETVRWFERITVNDSRIDLVFEEDEKILAMTGLTNFDVENGLIEMYVIVNPDLQGQGYGQKACMFTTNYAFKCFKINKVYLFTNAFNKRANNLYLKLGFNIEGTLRKHKYRNGDYIDRNIFGLLREEWENLSFSLNETTLESI